MKRIRMVLGLGLVVLLALGLAGCDDSKAKKKTVAKTTFTNEGSVSAPMAISLGAPHGGSIAAGGTSFYRFTTGTYPLPDSIGLTGVDGNLGWILYSDAGFSTVVASCNLGGTAAPEYCVTPSPLSGNTAYYLKVTESAGIADTFTVLVQPGQYSLLPNTLMAGSVAVGSENDYAVPVVTGSKYLAVLAHIAPNPTTDVDLYLYGTDPTVVLGPGIVCDISDNTFLSNNEIEDCTFTATAGVNYAYLGAYGFVGTTDTYDILVRPAPSFVTPVNEGLIGTPISLTRGVQRVGQVSSTPNSSFYTLSGITGPLNIILAGMRPGTDLDLYVSLDTGYKATAILCDVDWTQQFGSVPEQCTLNTPPGTLYIEVYNYSGPASEYLLLAY